MQTDAAATAGDHAVGSALNLAIAAQPGSGAGIEEAAGAEPDRAGEIDHRRQIDRVVRLLAIDGRLRLGREAGGDRTLQGAELD